MRDVNEIQKLLAVKFEGDYLRISRMAHFMGLLKTALDGMVSLGVVIRIEAQGLDGITAKPPIPDPLASMESAIALMQEASKNAG